MAATTLSADPAIRAIQDRLDITDVLYRYASTIDSFDHEGLRSTLADDLWAQYGNAEPVVGGDAVAAWIAEAISTVIWQHHLLSVYHVDIVEDGLALPADADYWRRRAAGGAAMLTVGGTVVAPESTWRRRITSEAWRPAAVPGMAARAEAIRAEGAVAACQLVHLGRETTGAEQWFHPVAPSAGRSPP